jgi:hypothetical protein
MGPRPNQQTGYVFPPFLLEKKEGPLFHSVEATSEARDDEPHLAPDDLAFQYSLALRGFTTEYEYATKNQKAVPYPDFAAVVFNNIIDNIEENIKKQEREGIAEDSA